MSLPRGLPLVVMALSAACILPDREISFQGGPSNPGAVRIVERSPQSAQMDEVCHAAFDGDDETDDDPAFCQPVRGTMPSGLVTSFDNGPFCLCPGGRDERAIAPFFIYAEDPDLDGDSPADRLYGALLLDPDPFSESPGDQVAYGNYFEPCASGINIDPAQATAGNRTVPSAARETPPTWEFRIDDGENSSIDLCNDNRGNPVDRPGLHNLQFMVTDREFFRPPALSSDGEPILDSNGRPRFGPRQCGVPDLAVSATYSVINFVFECVDSVEGDRASECLCVES